MKGELIKRDGYYIPWEYKHFENGKKMTSPEDVNADLPKISWCEKHEKYKLEFCSADSGGYCVNLLVWYFDTLEEIYTAMKKGV